MTLPLLIIPTCHLTFNMLWEMNTENFVLKHCTLSMFEPSECKDFIADGCTFTYTTDFDKIMDTGLIENSDIQGLKGYGPSEVLTLRNNGIHDMITASTDSLISEGNTYDCDTLSGDWKTELLVAFNKAIISHGDHFYGKNDVTDSSIGGYGGFSCPIQIAGSTTIVNNYTIQMPLSGNTAGQAFLSKIQPGSRVMAGPGTIAAGGYNVTSNNYGTVEAIRDDNDNGATCQVDIQFQQTVNANDYITPILPISEDIAENTYVAETPFSGLESLLSGPITGRVENIFYDNAYHFQFNQSSYDTYIPMFGRVKDIVIDVVKPYTGTSKSTSTLEFQEYKPIYNGIDYTVDLKIAGQREIGVANIYNAQTGDTLSGLSADNFINYAHLWSTAATDPSYQLPIINITVDMDAGL